MHLEHLQAPRWLYYPKELTKPKTDRSCLRDRITLSIIQTPLKALNQSLVTCGLQEMQSSPSLQEQIKEVNGPGTIKNEDNMKKNHSIVLFSIFRIIPWRQVLLQALPLKKKRKVKVVHTEIDPSQTEVQPNEYWNGFQSNIGTTCR